MNAPWIPLEISILLYIVAASSGIIFHKEYRLAIRISCTVSAISSCILAFSSAYILFMGKQFTQVALIFGIPVFLDSLTLFMLTLLGLLGVSTALYSISYMERYIRVGHGWLYGMLYNIFMLSLLMVSILRNLAALIFFWEIMTLSSYLLIIWEYDVSRVRRAGFRYFTLTHLLSTLPLTAAILLIHIEYGTVDIVSLQYKIEYSLLLCTLLIIGCGSKAGIFPFHFWIPEAQLVAPSGISAMISSGMNNVAFYTLIRLLYLSKPYNPALGYILVLFGIVTVVSCCFLAFAQHEYKKTIAYYSMSHMGFAWLAVGASLVFLAEGVEYVVLASLALSAGLYQLLNNVISKASLFMNAGSILYETGNHSLFSVRGVSKVLPVTSISILIASFSMIGLPLLSGFFSKWLIYQTLIGSKNMYLMICGIIALAITVLSLSTLIELYSKTIYRGFKLREIVLDFKELPLTMLLGQGIPTVLCIILGVIAPHVVTVLASISSNILNIEYLTVLKSIELKYFLPIITVPYVHKYYSLTFSQILFATTALSMFTAIFAHTKISRIIVHEVMHEFEIIKREVMLLHMVEKRVFHRILLSIDGIFNTIASFNLALSTRFSNFIQYPIVAFTSYIKLPVEYYNVLRERISYLRAKIFSVALKNLKREYLAAKQMLSSTSRKHTYLHGLVSKIDYQKTVGKYLLLKELEVRDTEREIYFDEILWKPLAAVLIKLMGRIREEIMDLEFSVFAMILFILTVLLIVLLIL